MAAQLGPISIKEVFDDRDLSQFYGQMERSPFRPSGSAPSSSIASYCISMSMKERTMRMEPFDSVHVSFCGGDVHYGSNRIFERPLDKIFTSRLYFSSSGVDAIVPDSFLMRPPSPFRAASRTAEWISWPFFVIPS
jgi:hypothetical protein